MSGSHANRTRNGSRGDAKRPAPETTKGPRTAQIIARALASIFADVARYAGLAADAPRTDPAVAAEIIGQAALAMVKGAGAEYGLHAEDASRLVAEVLRRAADRVEQQPVERVPPKRFRVLRPVEHAPKGQPVERASDVDLDKLAAKWSATIWHC